MNTLKKLFDGVLALLLAAMVVLVFGNVLLRYGFNSGIVISEEMSRLLFVWLTFLGTVLAMVGNEHIGMDLVVKHVPPLLKKILLTFACTGITALSSMLAFGAWTQMQLNWDNTMPVSGMPMAYLYLSLLLCGSGLTLLTAWRLLRFLFGKIDADAMLHVHESTADIEETPQEQA